MRTADFKKLWDATAAEARWQRLTIGGLVLAVLVLAIMAATKREVVVVVPAELDARVEIGDTFASPDYLLAWGLFIAQVLGNVGPASAEAVRQAIEPVLDPAIKDDALGVLERQLLQIQDERISLRFELRKGTYEPQTGKVFVQGYSIARGVAGTERREERTFEFVFAVRHHRPFVTGIATYAGRPRTLEELRHAKEDR
ncbi:traE [Skermanella stibiiresistens SB22]|uniref:TraE n=1 Tax=Skermanella stibiiresistens SB22 TaxID=1385369 RepID=W9GUQ4_9PROT|nr:TraE/TraK family type IV conjugative transfer system protein [Skermanella stibiiresistens]EWY36152.1 traE [Skermanella stibiiresistens SB22]